MAKTYQFCDFKKIVNALHHIPEVYNPEQLLQAYKETFRILDSLHSVFYFIHDFVNFRYLYVSKSFKSLSGYDPKMMLEGGFAACLEYIHPQDRISLEIIHKEIFNYLFLQPPEDRYKLRFDFNYRFRDVQGNYRNILQQSMFIVFADGKPIYDFSTCSDLTLQKKKHKMELLVQKLNEEQIFERVHYFSVAQQDGDYDLTKTELMILQFASLGLSSKEIAAQVSRSLHTINNHRKSILSKTNCKNLQEAILKVNLDTHYKNPIL